MLKKLKSKMLLGLAAVSSAPIAALAEDPAPTIDPTLATDVGSAFAAGFKAAINSNSDNFKNAALAAGIVFVMLLVVGLVIKVIRRVAGR